MIKSPMSRVKRITRDIAPWAVLFVCIGLLTVLVRTELAPAQPSGLAAQVIASDAAQPAWSPGEWWARTLTQVGGVWQFSAQVIQSVVNIDGLPGIATGETDTVALVQTLPPTRFTFGAETSSLLINVPLLLEQGLTVRGQVTTLGTTTIQAPLTVAAPALLDASLTVAGASSLSTLAVTGSTQTGSLVTGAATVSGVATLGSLSVDGASTLASTTLTAGLAVAGLVRATGGLVTDGANIDLGSGELFAANVVNEVVAGTNVTITGTRNAPIVSFTPEPFEGVLSINGEEGEVEFTEGSGISISGTQIRSTDTLSLVRSRGGCVDCITDSDVSNILTLTGGSIDGVTIGSTTRSNAYFSELVVGSSTATTTVLRVEGVATSTFGGGIDIASGCFSINGTCVAGGDDLSYTGLIDTPSSLLAQAVQFVNASGTALIQSEDFLFDGVRLTVGTTSTSTTLVVGGSASFGNTLTVAGTATSTFSGGINITSGCFSINGTCIVSGADTSYTELIDTPDTLLARAVQYVNAAGTAVTQSANFIFDGTRLGVGTASLLDTLSVGGTVGIQDQSSLRFYDADNSASVGFRASSTLLSSTTWTLPTLDGAADTILVTDGNGNLRFAPVSSVGGGSNTYVGLTDTPNSFLASAIPYVNGSSTALTQSANFVYTGTRLGIGTPTPAATLTVQGDVRFQISDSNIGMAYTTATNRFGFGTANPTERVTVQGGSIAQFGGTNAEQYAPQVRRNISLPTNAFDVAVQGNYAFVTSGTAGNDFHVIDISNPLVATEIASIPLAAGANGVDVQGNYAYVVTDVTGNDFHIIDISNPRVPVEVRSINLSTTATDVVVRGRYAYVTIARAEDAFQVVDISDPLNPFVMSTIPLDAAANAVTVQGNYAYVTTSLSGDDFHVINISDPMNPVDIFSLNLPDTANDIVVQGRYVYVVTNAEGNDFHIIDILNPAAPVLRGEVNLDTSANGVYVAGRYAYVTTQAAGDDLHVIDILNPLVPVEIGGVDIAAGDAYAVAVFGRYAYITSGTVGTQFHIVDISGAEFQSANIHTLAGGNLTIQGESILTGNVVAGTSLQVGLGGLRTTGELTISGIGASYINGMLGLGTSTPSHQLTVDGDMSLSGALYDAGMSPGTAGYVLQSTGTGIEWVSTSTLALGGASLSFLDLNDTPSGYTASRVLFTNGTADGVADAAGFEYGSGNLSVAGGEGFAVGGVRYLTGSTALDGVALGRNAGLSSTGIESVFLGNYAGEFNGGDSSTLVGYGSGGSNTGDYVVTLGYLAGYNNSGTDNIIIGNAAGTNTTGSYNTFLGSSAGYLQTGAYNEFIGFEAGRNAQGSSTVALGSEALRGIGVDPYTAERNVALGYRAGYQALSGASNNILIGYQAADNLSSGANNIVIGYDIDVMNGALSNQLVIGNLIYGTGIDGTGSTMSSGAIGIGNAAPALLLHVGDTSVADGTSILRLQDANSVCDFNANTGTPSCGSDRTLKKDIVAIDGELDIILALEPSFWRWQTDSSDSPYQSGFIAQEVETVLPELVSTSTWLDGSEKKFLNIGGMIPYIVGAIKELWLVVVGSQERITTLEERVEELEAQLQSAVVSTPTAPARAPTAVDTSNEVDSRDMLPSTSTSTSTEEVALPPDTEDIDDQNASSTTASESDQESGGSVDQDSAVIESIMPATEDILSISTTNS